MTTIITASPTRRAALGTDDPGASFTPVSYLHGSGPAGGVIAAGTRLRVLVESLDNVGGVVQRALLGGELVAGPANTATFAVGVSGGLTSGHPASWASALGRPLVPGLPDEFADPVLASLVAGAARLPGGTLTIDRAGYDERGSSKRSFRLTAALLVDALVAELTGQDPGPVIDAALRGW